MREPLRVLEVEDSESDAALIVRLLEKGGYEVHSQRVEEAAAMRAALENGAWDVIIADYHLPQFDAPAALRILHETGRDIPFIVVSARIGEDVAVAMMKSGAHDYLMKGNLARLVPAVEREIREAITRQERRRAERALQRQTELVNLSHDAIIAADANRVITAWNAGAQEIYGWTETEAVGNVMHRIFHTGSVIAIADIDKLLAQEGHWDGELVHTRRDGRQIIVDSRQVLQRDAAGLPIGILEINRDITERKRMEERLRDAQRAESIGLLAGGIAHDFNNILTAVSGNISLAMDDLCPECHVDSPLTIALESVQRAAGLTRQLLAYAGKGAFVREPVSVSEAAKEAVQLLRASLPKNVELYTELAPGLPPVLMDPSQMLQVLVNLIANAAEAIGETEPGVVALRTGLQRNSVRIDVSDTGCGMDSETQRRIFDPFFTTKFVGRGLGLAAVQGIIRSLNGQITVDSSPGQGTRIQVTVPIAGTPAPHPEARGGTATGPAASGAVLVADDEAAIRKMAAAFLTRRGIPVFEASTGQEAIDCLSTHGSEIRAVLLDMTMPELNGYEALPALTKIRPGIHVVVSSGYSDIEVRQHFSAMEVHSFLPKPYTGEQLLAHILPALEYEPPG